MGWMEATATILGVTCVALGVVRSLWTFPTAIVSVVLFGVVVFEQRLYSDAALQAFFVAANLYGWWNWRRHRDPAGAVAIGRLTAAAAAGWIAGIVAATIAWGTAMHRLTDAAYPLWDAGIAMASVAAQILMARRRIETWVLWIAVDLAAVPLYAIKELWAFAGLYVLYLGLSVWGLIGWHRAMRAS